MLEHDDEFNTGSRGMIETVVECDSWIKIPECVRGSGRNSSNRDHTLGKPEHQKLPLTVWTIGTYEQTGAMIPYGTRAEFSERAKI